MVAGVEKYFQIAKCFRDEDLRADRQPEFTQIDIEASFVTPDDIFAVTEGMLAAIFKAARNIEIKIPFDRLTYREAVDRYGSDKPDRRLGVELVDLGEIFRESGFKVFPQCAGCERRCESDRCRRLAGITIGQADELTEVAKLYGAKGLAFIKIENGEWKSPIVKFFSEGEKATLQSKLNIEEGDCVYFGADKWEIACEVLGRLRLRIAEMQKLTPVSEIWDFLWVTDFPLLNGARKKINGTRCIIHLPGRKRRTFHCLTKRSFPMSTPKRTRRRFEWCRDRWWQYANLRAGIAGQNVRGSRYQP